MRLDSLNVQSDHIHPVLPFKFGSSVKTWRSGFVPALQLGHFTATFLMARKA